MAKEYDKDFINYYTAWKVMGSTPAGKTRISLFRPMHRQPKRVTREHVIMNHYWDHDF